ncbi:M15 family metallopeptidase [Stenotrophomonas rhizophila]|uniref:M15 family metallopeptidase n=1 Tax=Stenotrophomonas rhizophila TaxID=216778 RepID=UPI001E458F4B|nr:M15 family metallopeptidase [Stenotrophomonas rhizophila]MCC7635744.1 M15 family metallopeptidase [Stenotrophomonas rhizophila]MCC7664993.1 M15 family metallopeptidase [Stenotrophomonas rhizophila]
MTTRTCTSPVVAIVLSTLLWSAAGIAAAQPVQIALVRTTAQAGMVDIRSLAPDIDLDMRYAGSNNFTGRPVPGYEAPKCFLLASAAKALAAVDADLRANGYGLRLFDCYRPAQSVQAFVDWAHDPLEQSRKARQYPGLEKTALLGGYIAESSGHSRGATVDLTLLDCRSGSCTALDMGTDFDFFGPRAHTDAPDITPDQYNNRQRLRQAMARQGFKNYPLEWWHYTLSPEPSPHTAYDVPVR